VRVSICSQLILSFCSILTGELISENPPQHLFYVRNVEIRAGTRKETFRPSGVCTALANPALFTFIDL